MKELLRIVFGLIAGGLFPFVLFIFIITSPLKSVNNWLHSILLFILNIMKLMLSEEQEER